MAKEKQIVVEVEVNERAYDYRIVHGERVNRFRASPRNSEIKTWGSGDTIEDAIMSMINTEPSLFPSGRAGLVVYWMGKTSR